MTKKPKKKKKSLTTNELKALELVAKDPTKSNYAIGKQMKELGIVKDDNYLIHRVRNNKVIRDKIAIYKESFEFRIARKGQKIAKVLDFHLNNNSLKAALGTAKLITKQDDAPVRQPMIHVETLNLIRGNQLLACQDKLDAIEVQENGNDNE